MSLFRRRQDPYVSSDREPEPEEHEEIEYEPVSVRELLTEMKDISELIVDLAYSSVVLDSKEIAGEVHDLESRMETLNYQIRLQAMMSARSVEAAEQLTGILQVASAAEKIADAAADISRLLESTRSLRQIVPRLIADADEKLTRHVVAATSKAVGQTIGEAGIEVETGNRIIALRRGRHWIYGPRKRFTLASGDTLICRGRAKGAERLSRWLGGEGEAL